MDVALLAVQELAFMRALGVDPPGLDALVAITQDDGHLAAWLSRGRVLRHHDALSLAALLLAEGVAADDVRTPDWRTGDITFTNGERIAILTKQRKTGQNSP